MTFLRSAVWFLAMLVTAVSLHGAEPEYAFTKLDLEWGTPLKLKELGGANIELYVRGREMRFITIETLDFDKQTTVPVKLQRPAGVNWRGKQKFVEDEKMIVQPSRKRTKIPRDKPVRDAAAGEDMHLIYEDATAGIKVFFREGIAPQNRDMLTIGILKRPVPVPEER